MKARSRVGLGQQIENSNENYKSISRYNHRREIVQVIA